MLLPRAASASSTPPQPNSTSSGCAPTARMWARDLGVRDIGTVGIRNRLTGDKFHPGRVGSVQILQFPGTGDVMGAADDGLHPTQTGVAGRADLRLVVGHQREADVSIAAF